MSIKLSVSDDGHYLEEDGTPFLLINETIWYMAQRTTRANVDTILDALDGTTDPTKGCVNAITLSAVIGTTYLPHVENPPNMYGHVPFNGGSVPDFSDPKVVAGGTPDAPNDYWDHLEYIVRELDERDMYLNINPFWARCYLADYDGWGYNILSIADCRSFGEFIGDRYKAYDNVFWLIGGDSPVVSPHEFHYRALAEGILKGTTGCTTCPDYDDESALWDDVIMTYHGKHGCASDDWAYTEKWCSTNGIYNGRYYLLVPAYELTNPRPIYNTEGYGFWSMTADQIKDCRGHHYVHYLQGGCGMVSLSGFVWNITTGWETRIAVDERKHFVIMRDAIASVEWWKLIPDNTIILSSNNPAEVDFKEKMVASRSSAEDTIMVFFHHRSPKTSQIDLNDITTNNTITGTWLHPKDGTTQSAGTHDVDDNPTFTVPTGWEDGLLTLSGNSPYKRFRGISAQKPRFSQYGGRFA